ncbi:MAG: hypothetical protein AAFQ62_16555 [Pseudomonadota bacterium]
MSGRRVGSYVLVAAAGALLGALLVNNSALRGSARSARINVVDIADVSLAEAAQLRESRYTSVLTIEDVLALPGEFAELEALHALAARANAEVLGDRIVESAALSDPDRRDAFARVLLQRAVELDPGLALSWVDGPLRRAGTDYTAFVWRRWARLDFDTALTEASLTKARRALIAGALYEALPSLDDPRALEIEGLLGIRPSSQVRAATLSRVFVDGADTAIAKLNARTDWSEEELDAFVRLLLLQQGGDAIEWITRVENSGLREHLNEKLFTHMATAQPQLAIERLPNEFSDGLVEDILTDAFTTLGVGHPELASALLESVGPQWKELCELVSMSALARHDPARAMIGAEELKYARRDDVIRVIAEELTRDDVIGALEFTEQIASIELRGEALLDFIYRVPTSQIPEVADRIAALGGGESGIATRKQMVSRWAGRDARAALAWAQAQPPDEAAQYMSSLLPSLSVSDPQYAIQLAAMVPGEEGRYVRQDLAQGFLYSDRVDTELALADMVTDAQEREKLQSMVLTRYGSRNPEEAIALARGTGNPQLVDRVLASTIDDLGDTDPLLAMERIVEIQEPLLRAETARDVGQQLARYNEAAALDLIASSSSGAARDGALLGLARWSADTIDDATAYVEQVEDPALRLDAQVMIAFELGELDQARALEYLKTLDVPEDVRVLIERGIRAEGY